MKRIIVTGGSGKAGRAIIRELLEHDYQVTNIDKMPSPDPVAPYTEVELTDLGQTMEALHGADAVVHMAAIPSPGRFTDAYTFNHNVTSTYNVFTAALKLGLQRVVWASSETTLGLPFDREQPAYAPIDEDHPLYPESGYALSKVASEEMARQLNRWSGIPFIGFRFSNIMETERYQQFPGFWQDPWLRKWNLWGYVDARDVGQICRLGLEADVQGAEAFIVAAADTVMNRPNNDLMAEVFPNVPMKKAVEPYETLLSIDKARRILGYDPKYSWRDHLETSD